MRPAFVLIALLSLPAGLFGQQKAEFLVNPDRPFVYLAPDHIAVSTLWSENHTPEKRVWMRFVNNCNAYISVDVNGVPDGSPDNEVGLQYDLAEPPPMRIIITANTVDGESPEKKKVKVPVGRISDVGSPVAIAPGQSILFSLSADNFSKDWDILIYFEFARSTRRTGEPKDPIKWGGSPSMKIIYSLYDLPKNLQDEVTKH